MAVVCEGITMYDIRTSIKAVAAETIPLGASVYVSSDGLAYVVDNGKADVCHGWSLEAAVVGDTITIVTTCRMDVDTAQTPGARANVGAVAGGSAPSTTHAGIAVGFAVTTSRLLLNIPTPAADG
jgi:3D (Asp-Asp-Asp) domain-containing protein